jgi:hypothetical protein
VQQNVKHLYFFVVDSRTLEGFESVGRVGIVVAAVATAVQAVNIAAVG